jgi:hypothetical protein
MCGLVWALGSGEADRNASLKQAGEKLKDTGNEVTEGVRQWT